MEPVRLIKAVTDALRTHVKQERAQVTLLQQIDRLAIDPSVSLETAISKIDKKICTVFNGVTHVLIKVDDIYYPFRDSDNVDLLLPDISYIELYQDKLGFLVVKIFEDRLLSISIEFSQNSYFDFYIESNEGILDSTLESFVCQLSDQLHLLVRTKNDRTAQEKERQMVSALLASRVTEFDVWPKLLSALREYPPDWCPGKNRADVTQLLIARHAERTMHLVAGDGSNSVAEFVLMNESMTGKAALERWENAQVVRTDTVSNKFISYQTSKAEFALVVPIHADGTVIAVLNLEANEREIFNSALVSFYSEAARYVAPIVKTILERNARNKTSQIRLQYVLSEMLQKFGGTFGHLISQPFLAAKLSVGEVKYILKNSPSDINALKSEIESISHQIASLEKDCDSFVTELPNFLDVGPKNVESLLKARLLPLNNRAAQHGIKFIFKFENSGHDIYASSLFTEHIFNICFNSFQQLIEMADHGDLIQNRGRITISSKYERSVSASGDWKGVDFVVISISDNGGGMSQELLDKTRIGFTTKVGGNGYAIPAAMDYFSSIGGEMDFANYRNGLRTKIKLQAYASERHESSELPKDG